MKEILSIIFSLIFLTSSIAQDLDFEMTHIELAKEIDRYHRTPILIDETGIYYGLQSMGLTIEFKRPIFTGFLKVDFQGKTAAVYKNDIPYREKLLIHQFAAKNAVINIYENENRKNNTRSVHTTVLNKNFGDTKEFEIVSKPFNMRYLNTYSTANSKDFNRNVLLVDEEGRIEYNEEKNFYIACLNENGEILWKKNYIISNTTNYKSSIIKVEVNNNGDVLVIEKRRLDRSERKELAINSTYQRGYDYYTHFITNNGEAIVEKKLDTKALNPYIISTAVNPTNQNFYIFSVYGDHDNGYTEDYGFFEFTPIGKVVIEKFQSFSSEFVSKFHTSIINSELGNSKFNDNFRNIIIKPRDDNSGVYIVIEPVGVVKVIHYYVDLLVLSIDNEGKTSWSYRLPKFTLDDNDINPSSINVIYTLNNQLNIIYNELRENLTKSFDETFTSKPFPKSENLQSVKRIWDINGNLTTENYISESTKNMLVGYTYKGKYLINNHIIFNIYNATMNYCISAPLKN